MGSGLTKLQMSPTEGCLAAPQQSLTVQTATQNINGMELGASGANLPLYETIIEKPPPYSEAVNTAT